MKKYLVLMAFLMQLSITPAYAANVPIDMMFKGKPIDSLCFDLTEQTDTIDLRYCGAPSRHYVVKGQSDTLTKQGFIGYDWKGPSDSPGGYSYYHIFPANNHQYWIYAINNGGGSGDFSSLFLATRKDADSVTIKEIAGGDRCNGGIQDVSEKDHALTFSENLTSYDFIALADKKLTGLKAYDDLAACAVCCVAKAFYKTRDTHLKVTHITLNTTHAAEMPTQGKYAACFNNILSSQEKILTQTQLNQFAEKFSKNCMH